MIGIRLFTAINFDAAVKKELSAVQSRLRKCAASGNFSREENLHITLVFLGEQPPERVEDIKAVIEKIRLRPFVLEFSELGSFRRSGGDIWWLGAKKSEALEKVQRQLANGLREAGFFVESGRFVPHLTLAREVRLREPFTAQDLSIKAEVERISLMKSEMVGGILVYTDIG